MERRDGFELYINYLVGSHAKVSMPNLSEVEGFHRSGKTQKEYNQAAGKGKSKINYWVRKWQSRQTWPANGFGIAAVGLGPKEIPIGAAF